MKHIDQISVIYHDTTVGTLSLTPDRSRCAFEYSKQWLAEGFAISPIELPLKPDIFIAKETPFYGNFGIFEDSLPDGYGRYLLNRLLKRQQINDYNLTPLQRLSIIGDSGMGALCYHPVSTVITDVPLLQLDKLQQAAIDVLSEKSEENIETLYFNSGNSGGCRPKFLWSDSEGHWLVKMRHTYDPIDFGQTELLYNRVAAQCGIDIPDCKLLDNKYFASKRFDLVGGQRRHTATVAAILGVSINTPNVDYTTLLHLTGFLTQNPAEVEQMFRRMVFNVIADNKDDHAKNFTFIHSDTGWHLAPAYDLTYTPEGYNGEHATTVCGNGRPAAEDMLKAAADIRIDKTRATQIIDAIHSVCSQYGIAYRFGN